MNTITGAALLLLAAICLHIARYEWRIGTHSMAYAFAVGAALYACLGAAFLLK